MGLDLRVCDVRAHLLCLQASGKAIADLGDTYCAANFRFRFYARPQHDLLAAAIVITFGNIDVIAAILRARINTNTNTHTRHDDAEIYFF